MARFRRPSTREVRTGQGRQARVRIKQLTMVEQHEQDPEQPDGTLNNESKAERVAANGRPLGRGGITRDERCSPSTRVGCSRTGPECECLLSIRPVRLKPDATEDSSDAHS